MFFLVLRRSQEPIRVINFAYVRQCHNLLVQDQCFSGLWCFHRSSQCEFLSLVKARGSGANTEGLLHQRPYRKALDASGTKWMWQVYPFEGRTMLYSLYALPHSLCVFTPQCTMFDKWKLICIWKTLHGLKAKMGGPLEG